MNLIPVEESLGVSFKNKRLIEQALTHRSYLNENPNKSLISNERLEFLGDSILSLIVSNYLYKKYPHSPEGDLTNFRSSLVKTKTLAIIAQKLKLGTFLLLSKGEEDGGGRENQGILADTFESITGAIFLDKGIKVTTKFISTHLFPILAEIIETKAFRDYKSLFQENVQAKEKSAPTYKVLEEIGPDHDRIFVVGVYIGKQNVGEGKGRSKQEAEQEAAKYALEKLSLLK